MEKEYDAIIAGSGPAGGQCARELAEAGHSVLLLERSKVVGEPNFSSGGTVLQTVSEFGLPRKVIQSEWRSIYLHSKNETAEFTADGPQGYVLDYKKLKQFLFNDAKRKGADTVSSVTVKGINRSGGRFTGVTVDGAKVSAKVIIDATGSASILGRQAGIISEKRDVAMGIEYLMSDVSLRDTKELQFYLGDFYAPQGYMWVFPTGKREAKIGTARYATTDLKVSRQRLNRFIKTDSQTKGAEVKDVHGGPVHIGRAPKAYTKGNLLIIGDAAMLCNSLGGEGIRHALASGRFAADVCSDFMKKGSVNMHLLKGYDRMVKSYIGKRWGRSYQFAKFGYPRASDKNADRLVRLVRKMRADEIVEMLFNYRLPSMRRALSLMLIPGMAGARQSV